MAMASAEMLGNALSQSASLNAALEKHENTLRPIIARLQSRSRKMATVFLPKSLFAFKLRNFVMRHMPRAWLGRYFSNAIRTEIALAAKQGQ